MGLPGDFYNVERGKSTWGVRAKPRSVKLSADERSDIIKAYVNLSFKVYRRLSISFHYEFL